MKFCNLLRETSEEIPDIENLYTCYKHLKKTLKQSAQSSAAGDVDRAVSLQAEFVVDLNNCIQEINDRFIEREELRVIELGRLEDAAAGAQNEERCRAVTKLFVDFHGQMLLFIHSAMLSYTALLKILKKYAKKTGHEVEEYKRERLREMPICSTEIATSIAHRAEKAIDTLLARRTRFRNEAGGPSEPSSSAEAPHVENEAVSTLLGQVRVALYTWEQLQTTAATPSTVLANHLATFQIPSVSGSVSVSSHSSSVKSGSD